ncbi:helix-turn-helix domain-containing protein [Streptomyces boninensis]|uniref:helix-turn-helix domain-containing protein n=1 Tax=Streptomyces boninensis TaxID=2039455 RepID=UPI003B210364
MDGSTEGLAQRVAERLNFVFEAVVPAALGRPWSNREVSAATGVGVSRIAALRRGKPVEPVERDASYAYITARFTDRLNHAMARRGGEEDRPASMRAIAREAGMSSTYLDKLMDGRSQPTLAKLAPLAAYLGVDIDYFTADDLGAIARHFGVRREALTYEADSPVVVELYDTLNALAAYRRLAQSPGGMQLAFRVAELSEGEAERVAATVEHLLGEPPG